MTWGLTLFLHLVELMCCNGRVKFFFPQAGHCPLVRRSRGSSFGGFLEVAGGEAGGAGGEAGPKLLAGFGEDAVFPKPAGGALVAGFDEGFFFSDLNL